MLLKRGMKWKEYSQPVWVAEKWWLQSIGTLADLPGSGCMVWGWGKESVQWKWFWILFCFFNCRSWLMLLSDVTSGLGLKDKEVCKWVSLSFFRVMWSGEWTITIRNFFKCWKFFMFFKMIQFFCSLARREGRVWEIFSSHYPSQQKA